MNLFMLILTLVLGVEPPTVLTPAEWNLGRIERNCGVVTEEVIVENKSGKEAEIIPDTSTGNFALEEWIRCCFRPRFSWDLQY
jgi:hypothetical protein